MARDSEVEATTPTAVSTLADERQAQLRAIASDLLYWKGGLKVLKQARLPKWRGSFQWQIEARIEALQTAYARLHAEAAIPDGKRDHLRSLEYYSAMLLQEASGI